MKKLSLVAALTLSTMLSACGGGGGGGHSFLPPTIPDITNPDNPGTSTPGADADNSDITMMKTRVVKDKDGSFTNLVNDTLVAAYQEHEATSSMKKARLFAARANNNDYLSNTNICKSERDCNQEIFDNMKKILIDQNLANASAKELRDALILAGFKDDLAGMWDDVTELQKYIREHPDEIQAKTDEIYKNHTVTLENVKLALVEYDANQDSYVNFTLDEDKSINGIHIDVDTTSQEHGKNSLIRQGDENKFTASNGFYVYGLRIGSDCTKGACAPQQGHSLEISSETELQPNEIRARLLSLFEEKFNEGGFDSLHGGTNNGAFQEGDKEKFYAYAKDFISSLSDDDLKNKDMDTTSYDHAYFSKVKYDIVSDYQSAAKDMKLAYSDFGSMTVTETEKHEIRPDAEVRKEITIFAGGYEDKKITNEELQKINGEMVFKGKAIGGVNFNESDNWVEDRNVVSDTLALTSDKQDNATLTFNNGKQDLTAEFNNWYDVKVTKDLGGDASIYFTGGDKIQGTDKVAAENFKFRGQDNYTVNKFTGEQMIDAAGDQHIVVGQDHQGMSGTSTGAVDIGYYGEAGNPSEATGYIVYGESAPLQDVDRIKDLNVQIGFGAKRQ